MDNLKSIVECLLFAADTPLTMDHFKKAMPEADPAAIRQVLADLVQEHAARNGGFLLCEVAGGYQFRTRPEYAQWIRQLFQQTPPKLSQAAMETLAIIAYRQPVLRSEIEQIRGVNSGNTIKILLERRLIRVLGRREIPGRPLVSATTRKFLETFDLKDLKDLPTPAEIEDPAFGSPGPAPDVETREAETRSYAAPRQRLLDLRADIAEETGTNHNQESNPDSDVFKNDPDISCDTRQLPEAPIDFTGLEEIGPDPE